MIPENALQSVIQYLFAQDGAQVYAVLDAASVPNLLMRLYEEEPEYECLFMGELAPGMAEVVPYLVHLQEDTEFTRWVIGQGWGEHWGIFAVSDVGLKAMRQHFRSFLTVYDPDGKPLYFRYYDPRVLRVYLPTCNEEELKTVFGPVQYYLLESEDVNVALQFRNLEGVLRPEKVVLSKG